MMSSIDFDTQGRPDSALFIIQKIMAALKVQFNLTYNPFNTGTSAQPQTKSVDKWESLYNGLKSQASQDTDLFTSDLLSTHAQLLQQF